jgi:hypothetical protein
MRGAAGAGDDHLQAAVRAVDAYSAVHAGVRCADMTWHSCGIPNSVRIASAAHRVPVRLAAHDHADEQDRLQLDFYTKQSGKATRCPLPVLCPRVKRTCGDRIARWCAALSSSLALAAPLPRRRPPLRRKIELPYTQFTLPNGLRVILHEDHSVPMVSVNMWYHVGSARELPDAPGSRTCSST